MTELTPREILDAIRRGLEETTRRLVEGGPDRKPTQPRPPTNDVADKSVDRDKGASAVAALIEERRDGR